MPFKLTSPAFKDGDVIPKKYSCMGEGVSPELSWSDAPAGTKSFALIIDDPDAPAGTWTHWLAFNLPAETQGMPEAVPAGPTIPGGGLQGKNTSGELGYSGPCPPPGRKHTYVFTMYALNTVLDLKAGASKSQLLTATEGHILAQAFVRGTFTR